MLPYSNFFDFDSVAISPDSSTIVAKDWIWNPSTGSQQQLPYGGSSYRLRSVAISEDNKQILSCNHRSIYLWDISGETKSALFKEHTDFGRRFQNWELRKDGWISASQTKDRLMWLPKLFRQEDCFAVPSNVLLLSQGGYYSVDFSRSLDMLGPNWATCYIPPTSAAQT